MKQPSRLLTTARASFYLTVGEALIGVNMKKFINNWIAERRRMRELNEQLEGLTNHLFFYRYEAENRS